jgi:type II secretory pathway pseudopilin PulG
VIGEHRLHRQAGFTYIALLIAVAIVGVWLSATANVLHLSVQREKEQELLYIGQQFRLALERYASSSQGNARRLPTRLEDLLLDERLLQKKRHLRRIYVDPMTGKAEWGLVQQGDGQITGVYSLSTAEPLKKAGFSVNDSGFVGKQSYSQWVFVPVVKAGATRALPVVPPSLQPVSK